MTEISVKTCGLCELNISKYCCPKCEILYCSLECYKSEKHAECSENFYRDCVNEELASSYTDDESKQKMIDILKRLQNHEIDDLQVEELIQNGIYGEESGEDSDDNEEIDIGDRIKDLNVNDPEALWNALTQDERNEFEALVSKGEVGDIIPHWEPWWMYHEEDKLVEDISKRNEIESVALSKCPTTMQVPKLQELTSVKPAPSIKYNILNVLASYAFIMRYFNGDIDPLEAAVYVLNICSNLDNNANYDEAATAVTSVSQKCLQSQLIQTDEASLNVMKMDSFLIVQGPSKAKKVFYCKAALSHLHQIFTEAKSILKTKNKSIESKSKTTTSFFKKFPEHNTEHLPKVDVSKIIRCVQKIDYYLSFIEQYDLEIE